MKQQALIDQIKGKVIISCQALPGEPLYDSERSIMPYMARAAKQAGTPMIRANSVRDILAIKAETGLPIIGIIKQDYEGYDSYITATMTEVDALVQAGTEIIALDCTHRRRGDGLTPGAFIEAIHRRYPAQLLMADISTYEEGLDAYRHGINLVSTTMSGYTDYSPRLEGPDVELVRRLAADLPVPVLAEGRVHTPQQAVEVLEAGAWAVIVGGAITRPLEIAARFMKAVEARRG